MVLLHYCFHQIHIKRQAKTILLMLIKRHFILNNNNNIITIQYSSNTNGKKLSF